MKNPIRGIQVITWNNVDKTTTTKYRVRISRKSFKGKRNNYFDNLEEAKAFLNLSKLEKGKELIYSITEEQRIKESLKELLETNKNYTFQYFVNLYLENYVLNREPTTELIKRNQAMKKAFLSRICKTAIVDRYLTQEEKEVMGIDHEHEVFRAFGGLDIRTEIKAIEINNYIKSRLKGSKTVKAIKPVSVAREITFISNVYNKLIHFDEKLDYIKNPTRDYDKSLLQNVTNYRKRILNEEEEFNFINVINAYSNKQLSNICKLSLLTSMRKSEIIFLKKSQIKDNYRYIYLPISKSGKSREVYLDETARQFLMTLNPADKAVGDRFFTYSLMGFSKVFSELMIKNNMRDIHFHDLRRTKISKMLSIGSNDNSILIAKLLGFQSVKKFEQVHLTNTENHLKSQSAILKTTGHDSIDTNFKHYFNPVFTEINKLERIKILKDKRKIEVLSNEEQTELLNLILELQE